MTSKPLRIRGRNLEGRMNFHLGCLTVWGLCKIRIQKVRDKRVWAALVVQH
jgi:hypothetical protein